MKLYFSSSYARFIFDENDVFPNKEIYVVGEPDSNGFAIQLDTAVFSDEGGNKTPLKKEQIKQLKNIVVEYNKGSKDFKFSDYTSQDYKLIQ